MYNSVANQKGGVGKTTTAINLSSMLAKKGCSTLLIDLDPQGHCGVGLGIDIDKEKDTMYKVLLNTDYDIRPAIKKVAFDFDFGCCTPKP